MHYYQFNIADYRKDTQHLSLLEHAIYRSLLDTYYLEESPLCKDDAKLMRTHSIRTSEEKEAFKNVISDFFALEDDGYHHKKCDEELSRIYEKSEKARLSAKKRWEKKANGMRTHSEGSANGMLPNTQDPIPNTQEPKKNKAKRFTPPTVQEVSEYCLERKNGVNPQKFVDYYQGIGWMRGKSKVKCWKSCVRTWEQNIDKNQPLNSGPRPMLSDIMREQRNGI